MPIVSIVCFTVELQCITLWKEMYHCWSGSQPLCAAVCGVDPPVLAAQMRPSSGTALCGWRTRRSDTTRSRTEGTWGTSPARTGPRPTRRWERRAATVHPVVIVNNPIQTSPRNLFQNTIFSLTLGFGHRTVTSSLCDCQHFLLCMTHVHDMFKCLSFPYLCAVPAGRELPLCRSGEAGGFGLVAGPGCPVWIWRQW